MYGCVSQMIANDFLKLIEENRYEESLQYVKNFHINNVVLIDECELKPYFNLKELYMICPDKTLKNYTSHLDVFKKWWNWMYARKYNEMEKR